MAAWSLVACFALFFARSTVNAATRRYYVQAEKDWWSFAEESERGQYIDRCTGKNYTSGAELYMQVGVGSRYLHARYVAYTDETFTTKYDRPAEEEHLQITGPLLRTAVGDMLEVTFRNTLEFDVNFVPSGLELSENDTEPVATNDTKVYSWNITERKQEEPLMPTVSIAQVSPSQNETSSKVWLYGSTIDPFIQDNMGLIGGLLVARADAATADGRANDTDIEFFMLFHVFDENTNMFFNETLDYYNLTDPLVQSNLSMTSWHEANLKHAINGKMFCWNAGFNISAGKRARWHVAVVGGQPDIHNFHWHGMVLNHSGSFVDQLSLFSGSTFDADMICDNPGTWLVHCHINDHIHAGMVGLYTLEGDAINMQDQGDVQQYYIAANEMEWDYLPQNADMCGDSPQPLSQTVADQLTPNNFSLVIGHKQIKVIFEEYTDKTFTTKKTKDPALGFLGPTLRAKVGDTIKIVFKNNARFTTGLHPHGVLYNKSSEGAPYDDGTSAAEKVDDYVHTGQTWEYVWYVVDRSSPGPADGSSVVWMYHSHSHEIQDSYAGLMGAIIVTRKEMATPNNTPMDVSREYVLMFGITSEAASFMLRANLAKYLPGLPTAQYHKLLDTVPSFTNNDMLYSINGYLFCNGPSYYAITGETVRFYIITLGTEADLHTPDNSLQWSQQGRRSSALLNIAGGMQTADVIPQAAGDFMLQCRTAEHVDAGMIAKLHVQDSGEDLMASFNGSEWFYYISAEELVWDYIPSGMDKCSGEAFTEEAAAQWGKDTMGHKLIKAVYRQYTDETFSVRVPQQNPSDGMAGPTIHAEVGDMVTVVFLNNASFPANLQLSGGFVPLHNASLIDSPLEPGESATYSWIIAEDNGPGEADLSTVAYSYASNADKTGNLNAGLFGAIVIARKGELQSNGLPKGVDYEIPLFFNIMDESKSSLLVPNLNFTNFMEPSYEYDYDMYNDWVATAQWETLNGYVWCNQENVVLNMSSTVRWILVGLGGQVSLHTPLFTNAVLLGRGETTYTTKLAPTVAVVVDMRSDFPGSWEYRCNVQEHYDGGMRGIFEVRDPAGSASIS